MAKKKRIILLILAALGLYGIFIAGVVYKEQGKIGLYYQQKQKALEGEYLVALNGFSMLADFIFNEKINTPEVLQLMHQAKNRPADREAARAQLLAFLTPLYARITALHFRQLHFHMPDSSSFLRFHRPKKFGDSLVGIRDTVVAANTTLQKVSAFEEGRIFNGFRFVYPLFYADEHVGSVEISISFAALHHALSQLFNKTFLFVLNREVVEKKVFPSELINYKPCALSPNLLHDRKAETTLSLLQTFHLEQGTVDRLNQDFASKYQEKMRNWQPITVFSEIGDDGYVASMLPIKNFRHQPVAYLISYEEDTVPLTHRRDLYFTIFLLTVLSMGAVHFLIYTYLASKRYEILSATDALTGIWNRGKGTETFSREHERALRYNTPYSLIMFDIDKFKDINDTFGHEAGDEVLIRLTGTVRDAIRKTDYFCRWGGEEFIIFLPETAAEAARVLAEKIRRKIAEADSGNLPAITVSLGATAFVRKDKTIDDVIRRADAALYEAKNLGRNRVCLVAAEENNP